MDMTITIAICDSDCNNMHIKPGIMTTTFHKGWYLIYTKPRHEKKVHAQLTERQINSLLPTQKALRVWHDRKKYVDEPLFPSYVFIYLNTMQNYYDGIDTEGSLYYVKTGKQITQVSETVVNNIRLITDQAKELEVSDDRFHPGRKLVITKGALTGLSCEVVEFNNKQKLLVRVDLLKRNILITLPEDHLIAI
jgi:transcriptional antiterminator RfaH